MIIVAALVAIFSLIAVGWQVIGVATNTGKWSWLPLCLLIASVLVLGSKA